MLDPLATKEYVGERIDEMRADLAQLTEKVGEIRGKLSILVPVSIATLIAVLGAAIKVIFFGDQ